MTTPPLTVDQVRDRIAEMCGWNKDHIERWVQPWGHLAMYSDKHPIPASLDWIVRVWPEGWDWWKHIDIDGRRSPVRISTWHAHKVDGWPDTKSISSTGDELHDRLLLLLRVAEWLRDNDKPAFEALVKKVRETL